MIEYVHMINFQKHADKRVSFTDGVNYILGQNGDGKSSTIRAICWVAMNEGSSKAFRRTYLEDGVLKTSSETSVTVGIDGHTVKRVYSASKNEYYLDGEKLTGFGRDVPSRVSDLFKMSSINVSKQFSPLFLVDETSGGVIAEELAKIASLEEMEILTDRINADIRETSSKLSTAQVRAERQAEMCDSLSEYTCLNKELEDFIQTDIIPFRESAERLRTINRLVHALKSLSCVDTASDILNSIDTLDDYAPYDTSDIHLCVSRYNRIQSVLCSVEFPTDDISPEDYVVKDYSSLDTLIQDLKGQSYEIVGIKLALDEVNKELSEFSVCPLCGKEL